MHQVLDVVNEHDEIIGQANFASILQKDQIIRVTHVWVINRQKELLFQLHRRENTPCHFDASVGGKVLLGETYENAALRRLNEELGLTDAQLINGEKYYLNEPGLRMFVQVFIVYSNGPFKWADDAAHIKWYALPDLERDIKRQPHLFVSNIAQSLNAVRDFL